MKPKINLTKRLYSIFVASVLFTGSVISQPSGSSFMVDVSRTGADVADICRGQQIEEFNFQFQGGLYAQLINNPSFEELNDPISYWVLAKKGEADGKLSSQTSAETSMLNGKQERCIKLQVTSGKAGIANGGYWGIKLENNTKYRISFWAKKNNDFNGVITASLESNNGTVYAQSKPFRPSTGWQHFTCDLITNGVSKISGDNRFVLYASSKGSVFFDVVTAMPPTWKNRPNGLRPDLAEKLASLKMKYLQFPGGCTSESSDIEAHWNWKNSIGPLEERPGSTRNRWNYKNDLYFGLDEYFQVCEDMGAEPVYTCSAGISETPRNKEWYSVCPLDKMQPIIEDIIDLIEYCNGAATTKWGALRAKNGHPAPYNLKYIEIGNENGWQTANDYRPRYKMIHDAIKAKYPEMKIMFNGFRHKDDLSRVYGLPVDYVDEHFYMKDCSILFNKYNSIDPECKKICVAEYASSIKGNGGAVIGNYADAMGDAIFMLGCERNSERIWWTGYGNYAGLMDHGNFGPCIVWNDAVTCFCAPSYYAQKMLFTDNQGSKVLPYIQNLTGMYWSASVDQKNGKKDVLLKIVNNREVQEKVNISLEGIGSAGSSGKFSMITGDPDDENSIKEPEKIIPKNGTFEAGKSFDFTFPGYSVTVLRVSYN
jgi:alpha-L-arabinofuranosidase